MSLADKPNLDQPVIRPRGIPGRFLPLIRLKPFATDTATGRSHERHRRMLLSTVSSAAARGLSIITQLITVRLTLDYLGRDSYGLWMTISSTIAMASFADFGIGNGLVNAISQASGKDDWNAARQYIASGLAMLCGLAILLGAIFASAYPWIPWNRVFNVRDPSAVSQAGPAIAAFVACFLINMPLGVAQRTQIALQQGYLNSLWQCAASALSLISVLLTLYFKGDLVALIFAVSGAPALMLLVNGLSYFSWSRRDLRPQWRFISWKVGRRLFQLGLLFFVLQLSVSLAYTSDSIVIAQVLGTPAVTDYNVPARLFAIPSMLLGMMLMPLWPAYGEAISRGDADWAKRTLRRSFKISLIFSGAFSLFLLIFGRLIIKIWVGQNVVPTTSLLAGLAIWTVLAACGNCLAMFLNGAHVVRFQVIGGLIMAVANLVLSIALAHVLGVAGVVWGSVIAYTLATAIPCALVIPRVLASLRLRTTEPTATPGTGNLPDTALPPASILSELPQNRAAMAAIAPLTTSTLPPDVPAQT